MSRIWRLSHQTLTCYRSISDILTPSLTAIKPFPKPQIDEPTLEIAEFPGSSERDLNPYTNFLNHLYIYPSSLAFESQKLFSRARNIAVTVEVRDSDELESKPLEVCKEELKFHSRNLIAVCFAVHLPTTGTRPSLRESALVPSAPSQHHPDVV